MSRENEFRNPEPLEAKDEALFEALGKSKKRKRRKVIRTVTAIVLIAALVLTAVTGVLRRRVQEKFALGEVDVLHFEVTTGTVSTVVSGSGTLQNVDTQAVTVPSGVELTEILVSFGDSVQEGDLLAVADMGTVRSAMALLQTTMEELDKQISSAEGDKVSTYVKAGVSGRVKIIRAEKGMDVADAMVSHGALAVLSLDGWMAVDLQTDTLSVGDPVTVTREDGSQISGRTEYAANGQAVVLVTDNGPRYDEEVTVADRDGNVIGRGKLYIHNPLAVTGYAGTVSSVNVKENQKVSASTNLFTLTNTQTSANYDTLLRQRRDAEEELLELLRIQRSGGITAPVAGSVCELSELTPGLTELAVLSPDVSMSVTITVDESDILSLAVGQKADITVNSVRDDSFPGTVTEIDKTGSSGSYTAVVLLDKVPGMLPGMTASVDVRIEGVKDALIIPVDALYQSAGGAYVYTTYDPETQEYGGRTDVVTGIAGSQYVQIKSGLKAGDTVYYTRKQTFADWFGGMTGSGGGRPPEFTGNSPGRG